MISSNVSGSVFSRPTVISLIIANFITLGLAVAFNWNVVILVWIYFFQSLIIGFFHFFGILNLKGYPAEELAFLNDAEAVKKIYGEKSLAIMKKQAFEHYQKSSFKERPELYAAVNFLALFGSFHLLYPIFLYLVFSSLGAASISLQDVQGMAVAIVAFFVNHLFSFVYYSSKPKKILNIGKMISSPFLRIIPIHIVIFFAAFVHNISHAILLVLVFFVLLKTLIDVAMHINEHSAIGDEP